MNDAGYNIASVTVTVLCTSVLYDMCDVFSLSLSLSLVAPRLTSMLSNVSAIVGQDVSLTCEAVGFPTPSIMVRIYGVMSYIHILYIVIKYISSSN